MSQIIVPSSGGINPPGTTYTPVVSPGATITPVTQFISVDPTAAGNTTTTITLPSAPPNFTEYVIKDRTGKASTNNILVTAGGKTIDGQTTYTMAGNYDAISLLYNGSNYEVF